MRSISFRVSSSDGPSWPFSAVEEDDNDLSLFSASEISFLLSSRANEDFELSLASD